MSPEFVLRLLDFVAACSLFVFLVCVLVFAAKVFFWVATLFSAVGFWIRSRRP